MVGQLDNGAVRIYMEGIVIGKPGSCADRETVSDFHAFYGADGDECFCKVGIELFKHRIADTGRHMVNDTFDHTADGIFFRHGFCSKLGSLFGSVCIRHIQGVIRDFSGIKRLDFHVTDGAGVGGNGDAKLREHF